MSAATKASVQTKTISPAEETASSETIPGFFAHGVNFYKLFWIGIVTSFLGCMVETVFMLLTRGQIQNRSGVLYGAFSLVWGLGAVLFTLCFHRRAKDTTALIFIAGFVMGAGYEYACSWVQEVLFGACFWDYSHLPLNINGRVNLVFSAFWGLSAVVWVRYLYPALCRLIGKIPNDIGKPFTLFLTVLMCANVAITAASLHRMDQRQKQIPASNVVEVFLDRHYPDARLYQTFSTLKYVGTDEARAAAGLGEARDIPKK